jgi:pSer/pThr/pTyr-binding forkhead associated (FHA) protein
MSGSIVLALRVLTTLALYAFLGWALYSLYREVQRQSLAVASRRVTGISITVRRGGAKSIFKHFAQPEIILGRDPGSDIPLMDDTASARHAQLSFHHGQWWLEDLASTNGTFLNNTPITIPTVITSGDEIRCGDTHLTIALSENIIIEPTLRIGKNK